MNFIKLLLTSVLGFLFPTLLLLISVAFLLDHTVLNREFALAELERSNAVGIVREVLMERLPEDARPYSPAIASSIDELRPWFLQEARNGINTGYDFLLGQSESLQFTIETEPLRESLSRHLSEHIRANPPAEFHDLSPADQARALADLDQEIKANLRFKPVYRFDLDSIPADARTKLLRVREALGHFRFYDNLAIALAIVCALGLVLLRRSSAGVGFVLLFFGAGEFGACLLAQKIVSSIPPNPEIPRELLAYLPQFVAHLMEPLRLFGICAGAAGLLLIFIAFAMYVIRKFGAKEPAA
jgi:hypothetical protein